MQRRLRDTSIADGNAFDSLVVRAERPGSGRGRGTDTPIDEPSTICFPAWHPLHHLRLQPPRLHRASGREALHAEPFESEVERHRSEQF